MSLKNSSKSYAVYSPKFLICQFFYPKVLIDDTDCENLVQIVVKFSMEIDPKIFDQQ